jgi:hypothetical protein
MKAAIESFKDALRALEAVLDSAGYTTAEKTYAHHPQDRYHGMPKDAFHKACIAHRTRLNNTLRSPGLNKTERKVYEQRAANMTAAQTAYLDKQKDVIGYLASV